MQTGAVSATSGRIGQIDALRGWAALCVCVQHAVQPIVAHPATTATARTMLSAATVARFDLGRYGVVLFFLISGYVVPFSLHGGRALPHFAATRAMRLYPAFWLSVLAMVATGATAPGWARFAANLTMAPTLFGRSPLSGVYWTLFVELAFYALCAALFAAGLLRRAGAVFATGLACAAVPVAGVLLVAHGVQVPIPYLGAHLSFLLLGTLMRLAHERRAQRARHPAPDTMACALALLALASMPLLAAQADGSFTRSSPGGVLLAGAAAVATFVALHDRPARVSRAMLRLGAISYSIYLFHIPVIRVVSRIAPPAGVAGSILFLTLVLAGTLALAGVVYVRVERPMIALGRSWRRRRAAIAVAP